MADPSEVASRRAIAEKQRAAGDQVVRAAAATGFRSSPAAGRAARCWVGAGVDVGVRSGRVRQDRAGGRLVSTSPTAGRVAVAGFGGQQYGGRDSHVEMCQVVETLSEQNLPLGMFTTIVTAVALRPIAMWASEDGRHRTDAQRRAPLPAAGGW